MSEESILASAASPPTWRWVAGFLLVGMAWGLTTPFVRKAALSREKRLKPDRKVLKDPNVSSMKKKIWGAIYAVLDLLQDPAYAVPLLLNVTGSAWFFLLIGQAGMTTGCLAWVMLSLLIALLELSLTVPITNSLAFLFTVLGEWWAEGKVISGDTWLGMSFVLAGIALCVYSKS